VPPAVSITEDTTQVATVDVPNLVEATAFLELHNATAEQAAEVLEGLARHALHPPRRQASITSDLSDPWSVIASQPQAEIATPTLVNEALRPIIEEPTADAELQYTEPDTLVVSGLLSHNITPLGYCPQMMNSIGILSRPPCAFVSQYGQRIHLYNDGRCLNNVNVRNGARALKALPVCIICANRWKAAGGSSSSSGQV
jgi:hypothetical protein